MKAYPLEIMLVFKVVSEIEFEIYLVCDPKSFQLPFISIDYGSDLQKSIDEYKHVNMFVYSLA